jgi:hypothetical protein
MKEEERPLENGNCPYSWLNEWLCEYVDGTMDPSLRRVFEKYVQANPELKAHVERLRRTRQMLCACSEASKQEAPDDVCARVQEKVECDMLRSPRSLEEVVREWPVAAFASTLVVALVVGMFTGATLFAPEVMPAQTVPEANAGATPQYERTLQPGRAAPNLQQMRSMSTIGSSASFPSLMEYDATLPYAVDSANGQPWTPAVVQP